VGGVPVTVVELPHFVRQAEQILPEEERLDLIEHLARNPEAGAVMPGTGGVRKLRWGIGGRGKSGGARIIYYYHNATMPIFLLGLFAKNVRADLTPAEKNDMRRLVPALVQAYQERKTR
jgi:hypothetical protein